jgi:hypothetical protein
VTATCENTSSSSSSSSPPPPTTEWYCYKCSYTFSRGSCYK